MADHTQAQNAPEVAPSDYLTPPPSKKLSLEEDFTATKSVTEETVAQLAERRPPAEDFGPAWGPSSSQDSHSDKEEESKILNWQPQPLKASPRTLKPSLLSTQSTVRSDAPSPEPLPLTKFQKAATLPNYAPYGAAPKSNRSGMLRAADLILEASPFWRQMYSRSWVVPNRVVFHYFKYLDNFRNRTHYGHICDEDYKGHPLWACCKMDAEDFPTLDWSNLDFSRINEPDTPKAPTKRASRFPSSVKPRLSGGNLVRKPASPKARPANIFKAVPVLPLRRPSPRPSSYRPASTPSSITQCESSSDLSSLAHEPEDEQPRGVKRSRKASSVYTEEPIQKKVKVSGGQVSTSPPAQNKSKSTPKAKTSPKDRVRGGSPKDKKTPKEELLYDLKQWLNDRSDNKKDNYQAFDEVDLPPLGPIIGTPNTPVVLAIPDKKTSQTQEEANRAAKILPVSGNSVGLHQDEQSMAGAVEFKTLDAYQCQKRRAILGYQIFQTIARSRAELKLNNTWGKTQAQAVSNVDVNKMSVLCVNFDAWGWWSLSYCDEQYLQEMVNRFLGESDWARKAKVVEGEGEGEGGEAEA